MNTYDVTRGADWVLPFTLSKSGVVMDLSTAVMSCLVKDELDGHQLIELQVVKVAALEGKIELTAPALLTQHVPLGVAVFDVAVTIGGLKDYYGVGSRLNILGNVS